jgi:aryl-phospho-beta-D-glucosidase BglC (GH1 family)
MGRWPWRWVALLGLLSGIGACSGSGGGAADGAADGLADDAGPDGGRPDGTGAGALPRLRADGTRIVTAGGAPVVLRGVNLGAWFYNETWISTIDHDLPGRAFVEAQRLGHGDAAAEAIRALGRGHAEAWLDAFGAALDERLGAEPAAAVVAAVRECWPGIRSDSDRPLYERLERRFGVEGRERLLDAFGAAWIRAHDIRWLADQGFNLVRVPMGYRALTRQSHLTAPTELVWSEAAFARLEALLDWCAAAGVYAVVDLQESPGGHNDYAGQARLYDDPAMQALTVRLWQELSRRLRERDEVAAYSLLAEPFGAPSPAARDALYDRLVAAVRETGDDHLLVIHDGFFGMDTLPVPAERGWEGVVYSTHYFESATNLFEFEVARTHADLVATPAQARTGVPFFVGSFSTKHDVDWAYDALESLVGWMEERGWSWSLWTYKKIDDPVREHLTGDARTAWGLWGGPPSGFTPPDPCRADEETLAAAFAAYADVRLELNRRTLARLRPDAAALAEP